MKYGLDPAEERLPGRLSDRALKERRQAMDLLIHVAGPPLDQLSALVGLSGCNVLLTDSDGVVLAQRVRPGDASQFRDWGLAEGFDWSEAAQGTNGIGTCLAEGRALTISRDEHFHTRNTGMTCMDAPIWGPDGRLIAALDVSAARSDGAAYTRLIEAQVTQAATAIEAMLFRASFPRARIVVAAEDRGAVALIAVDHDDLTIGATRAALSEMKHVAVIKPPPLRSAVPGGFTADDFAIDFDARTVTCPAGHTASISSSGAVGFERYCRTCPLAVRCTTAARGRKLTISEHEHHLRAARAAAQTHRWKAEYRQHRPMVERSIAWLTRGNRKARYRGTIKNDHWLHHRSAALNLRRLITLGLTHTGTTWAIA